MAKHYKIIVNLVKGEEAINLAVQNGQPLRIWVVEGANYLLQAHDEQAAIVPVVVKARRAGKDLQLMFDGAPSAQVVLIGYFDVAQESHVPLLGRLPDGSLREYSVLEAGGSDAAAADLPDDSRLAELVLHDDPSQGSAAVAALAPLAPLAFGPGAMVATAAGLAAAAGGGGGGGGSGAPALTPEAALLQLQIAAKNNTASNTAASVYKTAGVSGVTDANVAAINDVLDTTAVTDASLPSKVELQKIVDAYNKVQKAADHIDGNMADAPTASDYSTLTLSGVTPDSAKMLSDVVDGKAFADVDTVAQLQALADASKAVIGYTGSGSVAPTAAQINSLVAGLPILGNVVVTSEAQTAVQNAIRAANTDADGAIASQGELATLVKSTMAAFDSSLELIRHFAATQSSGLAGQAIPRNWIPTLSDYAHVGVSGVSADNLDALNDALASAAVGGVVVFPLANLQTVIDAYNTILAEANGATGKPTVAQYAAIGADIGLAATDAENFALLNDAVGVQKTAGVDTIAEINNLARIANAIQAVAAGQTPSVSLTVADLSKFGLNTQGLSDNSTQMANVFKAIAAKADDGSQTDSLQALQAIIQSVLSGGAVVPVVLDLNGDGLLSYTSQLMDVNGDGQIERTAWIGQQDGVLVHVTSNAGQVHASFAFARNGQETDLQGLAAQYDSNHDGQLDGRDAAFGEFQVWQDANGNGVCDAGELHSLQALGLTSIGLHSDGVQQKPATGVTEMGHALATRSDGSQVLVADAAFAYTAAAVHATALDGGQWRLEMMGDHQALDLSNLRAVYGDVREVALGGKGHNTLALHMQDVLAQPLQVDGDASTVVALFADGQALQASTVERQGVVYQAYDCNRDGHLDLLIQQAVAVQTH